MNTVEKHYESLLAEHYSWMSGGFAVQVERNTDFFKRHEIRPTRGGIALDAGAGSGFQSIPLARAGFKVTAIDLSETLLRELRRNGEGLDIHSIHGDLLDLASHTNESAELIVCMGDTLTHLGSMEEVEQFLRSSHQVLDKDGSLVLTFRDLSHPLEGEARFIPVNSDENTIFTCFLEYGSSHVRVHDLVYSREAGAGEWQFSASSYRKLVIAPESATAALRECGFQIVAQEATRGMITLIAKKQ